MAPRLPGFNWRSVQSSSCRYCGNDMKTQPLLEARRAEHFAGEIPWGHSIFGCFDFGFVSCWLSVQVFRRFVSARLAGAEVFAADEVAIVHVMNRVMRQCFLLRDDPITGKNYDHRKQWIDDQLVQQAKYFGIDLLCQAIESNHFHLVFRSRPDVVAEWDDGMVARRCLMLRPAAHRVL